MSYLLDLSTLAELLRSAPPKPLVRQLSRVASAQRWTSVITVSQLLVAARTDGEPRLMQDVVSLIAAIRVAPYDLSAARAFAKLRTTVGQRSEIDDAMVAAIALSRDFVLVTRRHDAFRRFGVRLDDWTSDT